LKHGSCGRSGTGDRSFLLTPRGDDPIGFTVPGVAGASIKMKKPCRRGRVMRSVLVGALSAAILCGSSALAADLAAGKEKAELCIGCHGESGISQTENIPSLAGQPDQFIQWQLVFFRSGSRKSEQMQGIVEQINNDDIRNLGAYFASLAPPKASKPDDNPDLSRKGAQAALGRRCASCHTDTFAGTKAVARIAGQREEYLLKALHDYKSGVRSGGGVAAMADVAYPLSEEEITALAHYLAHL
jgi:cytochrome c553